MALFFLSFFLFYLWFTNQNIVNCYYYYSKHAGRGLLTPGLEVNAEKSKYTQPSFYALVAVPEKRERK